MRYYSEELNKIFPTEEECIKAEKEYKQKEEKEAKEKELKLAQASKRKKDLSREIELADQQLSEANKLYDVAKERAKKILEESNKQVEDILKVAIDNVRKASENKLNALQRFNKEFGTYKVTVTGEKAAEEFEKSMKNIRDYFEPFNNFFNHFWL